MKTLFSSAWLEAISCCGKDLQLKIIRAVIHYQETGAMPERMTPSVRMALRLIVALSSDDAEMIAPRSVVEDGETLAETVAEAPENTPEEEADDDAAAVPDELIPLREKRPRPGLSPIGKLLCKADRANRKKRSKK